MGVLILVLAGAAIAATAVTIVRYARGEGWKVPIGLWSILGVSGLLLFVLAGLETRAGQGGGTDLIEEWTAGAEATVAALAEGVFPGRPLSGDASWEEEDRPIQVSRTYVGVGRWQVDDAGESESPALMGEVVRWWGSVRPEDYPIRNDDDAAFEARYRDPAGNLTSIRVPRDGGAVEIRWRSDPVADTPGWWWLSLAGLPVMIVVALVLTIAARRANRWSMYPGGKKPVVPPPKWQRR